MLGGYAPNQSRVSAASIRSNFSDYADLHRWDFYFRPGGFGRTGAIFSCVRLREGFRRRCASAFAMLRRDERAGKKVAEVDDMDAVDNADGFH